MSEQVSLRDELQARIGLMPKVHTRCFGSQQVLYSQVSSLSEITRLVRAARTMGLRVRSVNAPTCLTTDEFDVIVDTDFIADEERIASCVRHDERRLVTVKPGVTVREFNEYCLARDLCLPSLPDSPRATMVELAMTGASGDSPGHSAISDFLTDIRIVDADGRLKHYRSLSDEDFDATKLSESRRREKRSLFSGAQCNLGMFGVVYDATFCVQKNYTVRVTSDFKPLEEVLLCPEAIEAMVASNQNVSVYWFPFNSVRGPDDPLPPAEEADGDYEAAPIDGEEPREVENEEADEAEAEAEKAEREEADEAEEKSEREEAEEAEEKAEKDETRESEDAAEEEAGRDVDEDGVEKEAADEEEAANEEEKSESELRSIREPTPPPELYSFEDWTPQRDEVFCRFLNACQTPSMSKREFDLMSPHLLDPDTGRLVGDPVEALRSTHRRHRRQQPAHSDYQQHVSWAINWMRPDTYPPGLRNLEYVFDAGQEFANTVSCVAMVAERVQEYKKREQFPLNCCMCVSFAKASNALMAPGHCAHPTKGGSGRTCTINVLMLPQDADVFDDFVRDLEMDLRGVEGARPHWSSDWAFVEGSHAMLKKVYTEDLAHFKDMIRGKLIDLDGVFLNRHLARVVESEDFNCQQVYSLKNRRTKDTYLLQTEN